MSMANLELLFFNKSLQLPGQETGITARQYKLRYHLTYQSSILMFFFKLSATNISPVKRKDQ